MPRAVQIPEISRQTANRQQTFVKQLNATMSAIYSSREKIVFAKPPDVPEGASKWARALRLASAAIAFVAVAYVIVLQRSGW